MSDRLILCPFCDKRALHGGPRTGLVMYNIRCGNTRCEVRPHTKSYVSKEQAIDAWNTRAEAGTVHNETGYSPRQLAEQKKALLDACVVLRAEQKRCNQMTPRMIDAQQAVDDAIAGATN